MTVSSFCILFLKKGTDVIERIFAFNLYLVFNLHLKVRSCSWNLK